MAGIIGNPIGYKRLLTSVDDLNNIEDGMYWTANTDNPKNSPSATYNNLIEQKRNIGRGDIFQIIYNANDAKILFRLKPASGQWLEWKTLATL